MLKTFKTRFRLLALACGLAVAVIISTNSQAKSDTTARSIAITFTEAGQSLAATGYAGSGNATHLGVYTSVGTLSGSSYNLIYSSPDGDHLYATNTETVVGIDGPIIYLVANGVFQGGTGRFANASGSFEGMMTYDLIDGSYQAVGTGVIVLPEDGGTTR